MPAPLILLEVSPRRVADGVVVPLYLAGFGGTTPYFYDSKHWRGGLSGLPETVCALDFSNGEFGTGGIPTAASVQWTPQTEADRAMISAYVWDGADAILRIGKEGVFPAGTMGKITAAQSEPGKVTLFFADVSQKLKVPVLTERYGGTGGLDGPEEWEGKIKERVFGRVANVAGQPIDPPYNIFCFSDPLRPIQSFDTARDKGVPASPSDLTFLAWQGTADATLEALRLAVAPEGGGVLCPSISCVKWWTEPAGDLCVDLKGEIGSGYVETTAEIVAVIAATVGGPAMAPNTVSEAVTARPYPIGLRIADDSTTAAAILDRLLGNVSLLWVIDAAANIVIRRWAWVPSSGTFKSHTVKRVQNHRPVGTRKLGYRHNENVMSRGDLAAIVLATEVAYLDGTPIENLKPAEAGADVTSNITGSVPILIECATDGTPLNGELPLLANYRLFRGNSNVTGAADWGVTENFGDIDCTISDAGLLTITAIGSEKAQIRISASYLGKNRFLDVDVSKTRMIAMNEQLAQLDATSQQIEQQVGQIVIDVQNQGSAITEIESAVGENTANIALLTDEIEAIDGPAIARVTNQYGVMLTEQEALAGSQLTALVKTAKNSAQLVSETTVRANEASATIRTVDSVTVRMGDNEAALTQEVIVRTTQTQALGVKTDTIEANVAGNTASIQEQSLVLSEMSGDVANLFAQYALNVIAGNKIAGMKLLSDGSVSAIQFLADWLTIETQGSGPKFEYNAGNIYIRRPNGTLVLRLGIGSGV